MRSTFPAYTPAAALGPIYGDNLWRSIKEFQRRTGLEQDGNTGPITYNKLKEYGFKG
jgi:murein L,D-transpeptidase YcbB/YkuD